MSAHLEDRDGGVPDLLEPDDVRALGAMAAVQLAAGKRVTAISPDPAAVALDRARHARTVAVEQRVVGERFALPKRVLRKFARVVVHPQITAIHSLADAVEQLVHVHHEAVDEAERQGNAMRAIVVATEQALQDGLDAIAVERPPTRLSGAASTGESAESQLALLTERVRRLERQAEVAGHPTAVEDDQGFYARLEARFRGSRAEIRQRQEEILRLLSPVAGLKLPVVDIGCGRGEWLELLRDAGVRAYGVDSNAAMIAEAVAAGVDARCEDAFEHLERLDDGSLQAVTAFHVVEHISPVELQRLVRAVHRVLAPGGVLLIETPNPTNLTVGASSFYLDPTHVRQVHPLYLSFLADALGFADVGVHYLHPTHAIDQALPQGLDERLTQLVQGAEWALFGPQDYALLAKKPAEAG